MIKVAILCTSSDTEIPLEMQQFICNLPSDTEFFVKDGSGIDTHLHNLLSRIGATSRSTVYALDYVKNNRFDLREQIIKTSDLEDGQDMYKARINKMCNDCDLAVVLWTNESSSMLQTINYLKIRDKEVYIFK